VGATGFGFAPDPARMVIARAGDAGIWLVGVPSGAPQRLSDDGWLPRWLP
jgi:hypothetical protein